MDATLPNPPLAGSPIQRLEPTSLFVHVTLSLTIATLLFFTLFAVILTRKHLPSAKSDQTASGHHDRDTEAFITARGTQGWVRIAWSFFAGALGAWAIATPANMAATAGIYGLISYAVCTGIPIVMVAFVGSRVQKLLPKPLSLSDFVMWRYGNVFPITSAIIFSLLIRALYCCRSNCSNLHCYHLHI
jgi:hypothetical protein